jgi:para-aminobenzoate synthetase component I
LVIFNLKYEQAVKIAGTIKQQSWLVLLDSCYQRGEDVTQNNRYDILAFAPQNTYVLYDSFVLKNEKTTINCKPDKFLKQTILADKSINKNKDIPFAGGYIGFFSYDFGNFLYGIKRKNKNSPLIMLAEYDWAFISDHFLQKSYLISNFKYQQTRDNWQKIIRLFERTSIKKRYQTKHCVIKQNTNQAEYKKAYQKIQEHIKKGDVYQINYAINFNCQIKTKAFSLYQQIRDNNPAPYSAFLSYPNENILSYSPEMFLAIKKGKIISQPIKGTRIRDKNPTKDKKQIKELKNSHKDKAENLMITDLIRNDLGKNAKVGSVRVLELFKLESFTRIHHLISTITAKIADNKNTLDVFLDSIPGGSITGAPKKKAMEIIAKIEKKSRMAYCGNIACFDYNGDMLSNITIRTAIYKNHKLDFFGGGGITFYSQQQQEYQECKDKVAPFFNSFSKI